jgi:hypothetical protein
MLSEVTHTVMLLGFPWKTPVPAVAATGPGAAVGGAEAGAPPRLLVAVQLVISVRMAVAGLVAVQSNTTTQPFDV